MRRMKAYYDVAVSNEELDGLHPGLITNAASFDAPATRKRLLRESGFRDENLRRFVFQTIRPAVGLRREERESLESCETGTLDSI